MRTVEMFTSGKTCWQLKGYLGDKSFKMEGSQRLAS